MPLDIDILIAKLVREDAVTRILNHEEAHEIADGVWEPVDDELLPRPLSKARRNAWDRMVLQMQTLGPRIMNTKMAGALSDVNWGGEDLPTDERLLSIKLEELATRLLNTYIVGGVTAALAHEVATSDGVPSGEFTISRLGGYLEPITDPDNVDIITGLYQAWTVSSTGDPTAIASGFQGRTRRSEMFKDVVTLARPTVRAKWNVRVYDWIDGEDRAVIREWRGLDDPTELGGAHETFEPAPVPRFAIWYMTYDGVVLGEISQHVADLRAFWATEARMTLTEELGVFPMLKTMGNAEITAVGPSEVIALPSDGDAAWMAPGDLAEVREQRALRLKRIQEDLALPGGFLGNDSPSGEAISEANVRFRQTSERYARDISQVMTRAVADFAEMQNIEAVPVAVQPDREAERKERINSMIELFREGVIPLSVIAREVQPFFPTWSDEELQEFIQERTAIVTPEQAIAALNQGV